LRKLWKKRVRKKTPVATGRVCNFVRGYVYTTTKLLVRSCAAPLLPAPAVLLLLLLVVPMLLAHQAVPQ
jgi:hypothetical protein